MPVQHLSQIERARLGDHLASVAPSLRALRRVERIGAGQSNPTFLLTCDGGQVVLRKKPPGVLLRGAHAIDREYKVLTALATTDFPVPAPIHYCRDIDILGSEFYLMRYVSGRVFDDCALPGLTAQERRKAYSNLVTVLAQLHSYDPAQLGLADFGKPGRFRERQLATWERQYEASVEVENADLAGLRQWLRANVPQAEEPTGIVHGDYRIGNLILQPDLGVAAVLDWEMATLGDPLMDLAYTLVFLRTAHDGPLRGLGGIDRQRLGIHDDEALIECYCSRSGKSLPREWPFLMALNFFRLAAILQGIGARARQGNAFGEHAHQMGQAAGAVGRQGREYVETVG